MVEIVYKDLSYKIIGIAFKVYNKLGFGHREKIIHRAISVELKNEGIGFKNEFSIVIKYEGKIIGTYRIDFVIEDKIVVEIKIANDFYTRDLKQLWSYLKANNYKLGILIIFNKDGVRYRRIVN